MFCSVCCLLATSNTDRMCSFVGGCCNFQLESVSAHKKSDLHRGCAGADAAKNAVVGSTVAEKHIETLNAHVFARMVLLFRNAHALAKNRRTFADFPWLCDLDERKGIDTGPTYRNSNQGQVFTHFITQYSRNVLGERLKSTPFLSIICYTGTQDQAFMEQEIVFVRSAKVTQGWKLTPVR